MTNTYNRDNKPQPNRKLKKFPPFPQDTFSGVAKEFIDIYSPIREAPPEFFGGAFLTLLGNCIAPYVRMNVGSSEPKLYLVNIGPSGATHKSSSNNAAVDFFENKVRERQHIIKGIGSAEGVVGQIQERELQGKAWSFTPDGQLARHDSFPCVLLVDEMASLATKTNIQGSVGIAPFHQLFESSTYEHPKVEEDKTIRNTSFSLLGASSDRDFITCWSGHHADAGWFSRLWLQASDAPEKAIAIPEDPPVGRLDTLAKDVRQLVADLRHKHPVYVMDSTARGIWEHYYQNADRSSDEWNRCSTYAHRFMVLFAAIQRADSITEEIVQRVIRLIDYQIAVRSVLQPVVGDNPEAVIQETFRKVAPVGEWITKRELFLKANARRKGLGQADRALAAMIKEAEFIPRRGRTNQSLELCRVDLESQESEVGSEVSDDYTSISDNLLGNSRLNGISISSEVIS